MMTGIPYTFTPQLVKQMMEMGHGEDMLILDCDFPYQQIDFQTEVLYIPVRSIADFLKDILNYFPLDYIIESAACSLPSVKEGPRFDQYTKLVEENGSKYSIIEKYNFFEIVKDVKCVVRTADSVKGSAILLTKGVVLAEGEEPRKVTEYQRNRLKTTHEYPNYKRWML